MSTGLIIAIVLIVAFVILFVTAKTKLKNIPVVAESEKIIKLTDKNFQHQTKNRIMLVDFWASWCAPCRMMAPVLNEVAEELNENMFVGKVDVEEFQALAQRYQIRNIPTMILFKNGKEYERFVGMKSKEFLIDRIRKVS